MVDREFSVCTRSDRQNVNIRSRELMYGDPGGIGRKGPSVWVLRVNFESRQLMTASAPPNLIRGPNQGPCMEC